MLPRQCKVIRDGTEMTISAQELVVGDVVRVAIGDQVPADIRLIWVSGLKIEMSAITGEPDALTMTVDTKATESMDATNLAWSSTNIMDGEGLGVVFKIGDGNIFD